MDAWMLLGDPTRRRIIERLSSAPSSVTQLADELPVSRPAVSQHLRLLNLVNKIIDQMVFCSRMGKYLYGSPIRRWLMRRETRRLR